MVNALAATFGQPNSGKLDFNNASQQALIDRLRDPLARGGVALSEPQLQKLAADLLNFRNTPPRSGLIADFNQLSSVPGVTPNIVNVLNEGCFLAPYTVFETGMVGPKVGADL